MTDARGLTRRELDCLQGVWDGLQNKEIATRLGIGYGSVKNHLMGAFTKLGVNNRVEAMRAMGAMQTSPFATREAWIRREMLAEEAAHEARMADYRREMAGLP